MTDAAPRAERGPYAKSIGRRREILDSALELFAAHGFEGTSLTAIGAAVGVSREGLRHYFASREELLLAVMDAADARSRALLGGHRSESLIEALAASATYNATIPGLVSLYVSLVAAAMRESNVASREFFRERFAGLRDELAGAIEQGQAAGQIRADLPAATLAALIIGASDGLSMQWLLDGSVDIAEGLGLLEDVMRPSPPAP